MKNLLPLVGMLLSVSAAADTPPPQPQFLSLTADQPTYTVGQKSVLTAYVQILPSDSHYELYLEAQFAGQAIAVNRISNSQAVSVTPVFTAAGQFVWSVDVYIQDARVAQNLAAVIAYYQKEIIHLNLALATTTDPQQIALLNRQIARDQQIVAAAQANLVANRRKVETDQLAVNVTGSRSLSLVRTHGLDSPPRVSIDNGLTVSTYTVGQTATFTISVQQPAPGPDGPKEVVVRATLDGKALGVTRLSDTQFSVQAGPFTARDVGSHVFIATELARSQAVADSLRNAIAQAESQQDDLISQRDDSTDPMRVAYLDSQIDALTATINSFYEQLESALTGVGTGEFDFQVIAGS